MAYRVFLALAILFGSSMPALAKCAPKNVLKIVVSFDAPETKTIYRSGERFGRIEDEKQLIVVSEPDVWMVNRHDMSGEHGLDSEALLVFRAPIIDTNSTHWNNFEYGCEVPFMRAVGSAPQPVAGSDDVVYEHSAEGVTAVLTVSKSGVPRRIDIRKGQDSFKVTYHAWGELRNGVTALFAKPDGIRFSEESEARAEP